MKDIGIYESKIETMTVKEVAEILGYKPDTMFGRIEIRTDSSHAENL